MAQKFKYIRMWPGKTELVEADLPPLRDDQILVRIELSGICATDIHTWEVGFGPHRISGAAEFPLIPGHEYVGVIEKKGKKADEVMYYHTEVPEEGDRIYWNVDHICRKCSFCNEFASPIFCVNAFYYGFAPEKMGPLGAWSQYVILEPGTDIWKLPKEMPPKEGVLIEPFCVGLRSVERALNLLSVTNTIEGPPAVDCFAIYGAGTIGLMALIALKNFLPQSTVIVLDLKKHRLDAAKELGADYTINAAETTREERVKEIQEIAASLLHYGRREIGTRWGVDAVFNCTGHAEVVPEGIEILRPAGGVFVETGAFVPKWAGTFEIDPHEICAREMFFVGHFGYPLQTVEKGAKMCIKRILKDKADIILTHELPLAEHEKAINMYKAREPGIKIAFNPWK